MPRAALTRAKALRSAQTADYAKPKVSIELVTPEKAAEFLDHNVVNRAVRRTLVQRYAQIIYDGEWHLNGETIKFDADGGLIDGQHRLMAVVESGASCDFTIVRGLPAETRSSIDIGARRTLADWLKMNGETDQVNLATAINLYWRFTMFEDPRIRQVDYPTYQQGLDLLNDNPGLRDTLKQWKSKMYDVTGRAALLCALLYWFSWIDQKGFEDFADKLHTGVDLPKGSPILVLRRVLANDRRESTGKQSTVNIAALVIKAFNYHRAGRFVSQLSWRSNIEEFPQPLSMRQINGGLLDGE